MTGTGLAGGDGVVAWKAAGNHIWQVVTVSGKIIRAHNHEDRILFLNFDRDRDKLSLVIFRDNFRDFDPIYRRRGCT